MKKTIFIFTFLLTVLGSFAQNELIVQNSGNGMYLNHTVAPKENFYSVGRMYNIAPKEIAAFNGIDMQGGLIIGHVIKIPLTASNFSQSAVGNRAVYYVVGNKEGLFKVSSKNNKVLMANLRKWNHLTNDNIKEGEKLIVGYLNSAQAGSIAVSNEHDVAKDKNAGDAGQPVFTPVQKQTQPAEQKNSIAAPVKPIDEVQAKNTNVDPVPPPVHRVSAAEAASGGGYFKSAFEQQNLSQPSKIDNTVTGGIFKTASGWQDAKYYALIDHADPGTIIKITNPSNNKVIYAKVLGEMSTIRQNQGYDIRISSAAAAALEIPDTEKFVVRVNF